MNTENIANNVNGRRNNDSGVEQMTSLKIKARLLHLQALQSDLLSTYLASLTSHSVVKIPFHACNVRKRRFHLAGKLPLIDEHFIIKLFLKNCSQARQIISRCRRNLDSAVHE